MKLPSESIPNKVLVKKEAETSSNYGTTPENRTLKESLNYGIVNIDKPKGPTSHQVADYVKKILNLKKAGHSGTLDPIVTGSLVVTLGNATKVTQVLLKGGKEYLCLMHLHKSVEKKEIEKVMNEFIGEITQLPPVKSSIKRQKRKRTIYYMKILEVEEQDVLFYVGTQAGTYIRKLCHDIGQKLEVGAHMAQLIRTKVGPYNEKTIHTLHELKDAYEYYKEGNEKELKKIILPVESAIVHLPKIWILDTTVDSLTHGADLNIPGISKLNEFSRNELVAILTLKGELVALAESELSSEAIMKNEKGLAAVTKKVFMKFDIYPKMKK
ncbi:RNA-guided pseudouridylation complex pseudouridine synthase subunit Cbf5 [Candidatus Woesearchaeota archaeon]|jgi:H/ACA ribonucleoprotein complex subunit 4|nr:RNA-guided pseudouridylation complex pseudouridine synthase subunit Cbf5 [Candidatus Woesearchaeota archaeon]MBT4630604.1 RNA-guided pseudouridylation complex pseudouridine synthase subunit Cbf5 [Candidatus Woesearchaeota archaeon]